MNNVYALEDAINEIKRQFDGFKASEESICLYDCIGRVLSQDVHANQDVPGFNRSSMDGYAVISKNTFGATDNLPVLLKNVGEVHVGSVPNFSLSTDECAYIATGGQLPIAADSVVMIENTTRLNDDTICIDTPSSPGNNIVFKGDDLVKGSVVLRKGRVLTPHTIGVLASLGLDKIPVYRKINVGVISTGDELVDVGENLFDSMVYDVNSHTISAGIAKLGATPIRYGIVNDNWEALKITLSKALSECDMVLISGGSSMGVMDLTKKLINQAGSPGVIIDGLAVKPGKPTILGNSNGIPIFGLPGHPISTYLIFILLVRPLLFSMSGAEYKKSDYVKKALLTNNIHSGNGREEFVPAIMELQGDTLYATPMHYKSGLTSMLRDADGFVIIPRNSEGCQKGETVEVLLAD